MNTIEKNQLIGSWTLIDARTTFTDGSQIKIMDKGKITYTTEGTMFASLSSNQRRPMGIPMLHIKDLNSWRKQPIKNLRGVINYLSGTTKYFSYTGDYEIQNDQIHHKVAMSSVVDIEGTSLIRHASFENNQLVLTANNDQGLNSTTRLVWQKAL